jgi:hypothetical protein
VRGQGEGSLSESRRAYWRPRRQPTRGWARATVTALRRWGARRTLAIVYAMLLAAVGSLALRSSEIGTTAGLFSAQGPTQTDEFAGWQPTPPGDASDPPSGDAQGVLPVGPLRALLRGSNPTPSPEATPAATSSPGATPAPTDTPTPTGNSAPTDTPDATDTPAPTDTPATTDTPGDD